MTNKQIKNNLRNDINIQTFSKGQRTDTISLLFDVKMVLILKEYIIIKKHIILFLFSDNPKFDFL